MFYKLSSLEKLVVICLRVLTWCLPELRQNLSLNPSQVCNSDRINFRNIIHVNISSAWLLQFNTPSSEIFLHDEIFLGLRNCFHMNVQCPYSHSRCIVNVFRMLQPWLYVALEFDIYHCTIVVKNCIQILVSPAIINCCFHSVKLTV